MNSKVRTALRIIIKALRIAKRLSNSRGIQKCQKELKDLIKNHPEIDVGDFIIESGLTTQELGLEKLVKRSTGVNPIS
ncbi:hypothetical protein [Tortoise microvirus 27]|nr:hypothetical protein [Tortoise microvirus 27]